MQHDVVIVGASLTGSAVATLATECGMSVALVEARAPGGPAEVRRTIPVPVWALEESRLPVGEVMRVPARLHLVAAGARTTVATPDCVMLEPAALVTSLVERARANGARFHAGHRVVGLAPHGDGVVLDDGAVIRARFVIDSSGASHGAALLGEPAVAPRDVASTAHETFRISERRLADAYLEAMGVERGESIAVLAPCGPGTLVVIRIDEDARTMTFDGVSLGPDRPDRRHPTARAAIRRVAHAYAWISECIDEDARHVPLSGLRSTLAAGNVALVGGAAGMTRPSRGAKCAMGIVSARLLVDCLAKNGDFGGYERRVRARFERVAEMDALLASHAASLDEDDLAAMIRSGAIGERLVSAVLEQRAARVPLWRFSAAAAIREARAAMARLVRPTPLLTPLRARVGGHG